MRVASRALAISSSVLIAGDPSITPSAASAVGSNSTIRRAMPHDANESPANPILAVRAPPRQVARQGARPATTSSDPTVRVPEQPAPARSPSHAGLTTRLTPPSLAITAAAGPID